jgi:uncharacterized membrane protein
MEIAPLGRLADAWTRTRNSYLLLPSVMLAAGIGLAILMLYVDARLLRAGVTVPWFTTLTASAGRTILATLAGSMATIAGVVFSIDIVALQLAASQFGPHVMRGFLSDRGSQVSLGTFVGTFVYALVVLVAGRAHGGFVPYVATYVGILQGVGAMVVLVYFINHIANLVRVESVIVSLAQALDEATDTVFPEQLGHGETAAVAVAPQPVPAGPAVAAAAAGYVRRIDDAALMRLACRHDLLVGLRVRPGDFVVPGTVLMVAGPARELPPATLAALRGVVVLGDRRTPYQDISYALQQLVEVALRALSPGINAPFTAIPAIDAIAAGLVTLASRRLPSPARSDEAGVLRVLVAGCETIPELATRALGPIATAARGQADVTLRLIGAALLVAARLQDAAERAALRDFAGVIAAEASATLTEREQGRIAAAMRPEHVGAAGDAPLRP